MYCMATFTDIQNRNIVVFDPLEKYEKIDFSLYKFCGVCKQLREMEQYKSLYRKRGDNKICRVCLNRNAKLKQSWHITRKNKK